MSNDQLFSESEIADIIRRAGTLQDEGSAEGYTPGVSGSELAKIAAEVGIAPEFLQRAVAEHLAAKGGRGKFGRRIERVLPVELKPEDFDTILHIAKPASSAPLSQTGSLLQGLVKSGLDPSFLILTSLNGRTRLSLEKRDGPDSRVMMMLWFGPLCFAFIAGLNSAWLAALGVLLLCVLGAFGTHQVTESIGNRQMAELADEIEAAVLEVAAARTTGGTEAEVQEDFRQDLTQN